MVLVTYCADGAGVGGMLGDKDGAVVGRNHPKVNGGNVLVGEIVGEVDGAAVGVRPMVPPPGCRDGVVIGSGVDAS